jgi:hypothetical protein
MRARAGHTLVECMIACTLAGSVLGTIALALHGVCRVDRQTRDAVALELEVCRLAAQFRADAHQAHTAKLEPAGESAMLSLALPGERTVQYTLQLPGVERVLRDAHTVLHREIYRLPASATARWHIDTSGRSPVASLVLEPGPADSDRPTGLGPCRVDAVVNLFPSHPRPSKP